MFKSFLSFFFIFSLYLFCVVVLVIVVVVTAGELLVKRRNAYLILPDKIRVSGDIRSKLSSIA
jgi:hypothetical protein